MYPAFVKRQHVEPFATLMGHLRNALRTSKALVVVGCSFRDQYLKELVIERMAENVELQLVVVDPKAAEVTSRSDENVATEWKFSTVASRIVLIHEGAKEAFDGRRLLERVGGIEMLPEVRLAHQKAVLSGDSRRIRNEYGSVSAFDYLSKLIETGNMAALADVAADAVDPLELRQTLLRMITKARIDIAGSDQYLAPGLLLAFLTTDKEQRRPATDWVLRKLRWVFQYVVWSDGSRYRTITADERTPSVRDVRAFFDGHARRIRIFESQFLAPARSMRFHVPEVVKSCALALLRELALSAVYFESAARDDRFVTFRDMMSHTEFPRGRDDELMKKLGGLFGEELPLSLTSLSETHVTEGLQER
jgi:hypothetical protein